MEIVPGGAAQDASFGRELIARSGQTAGGPNGTGKEGPQHTFLRGGKIWLQQNLLGGVQVEMVPCASEAFCCVAAKPILPSLLELKPQTRRRSDGQVYWLAMMVH
jgi:hypothetical protein